MMLCLSPKNPNEIPNNQGSRQTPWAAKKTQNISRNPSVFSNPLDFHCQHGQKISACLGIKIVFPVLCSPSDISPCVTVGFVFFVKNVIHQNTQCNFFHECGLERVVEPYVIYAIVCYAPCLVRCVIEKLSSNIFREQ